MLFSVRSNLNLKKLSFFKHYSGPISIKLSFSRLFIRFLIIVTSFANEGANLPQKAQPRLSIALVVLVFFLTLESGLDATQMLPNCGGIAFGRLMTPVPEPERKLQSATHISL